MPALIPYLGFASGLALAAVLLFYYGIPRADPDALTTQPLPMDRIATDPSLWPLGWPHEAPEEPLTVSEAHLTMQRHCGCLLDECGRKAAAYQTLVAAGHLTPDAGRTR